VCEFNDSLELNVHLTHLDLDPDNELDPDPWVRVTD
jgi:hypothetical protein